MSPPAVLIFLLPFVLFAPCFLLMDPSSVVSPFMLMD
jgi:hypothetical protein